MELLSRQPPPPIRGAGDHFFRLLGTQPASPEARSGRLGQVQGLAGAWGGAEALSPDRCWPAHLFISEAALDWVSRCLSPSEEQRAGAAESAAADPGVIDGSGAGPPAPALSGWGCPAAHCPPASGSAAGELAGSHVPLGSLVLQHGSQASPSLETIYWGQRGNDVDLVARQGPEWEEGGGRQCKDG